MMLARLAAKRAPRSWHAIASRGGILLPTTTSQSSVEFFQRDHYDLNNNNHTVRLFSSNPPPGGGGIPLFNQQQQEQQQSYLEQYGIDLTERARTQGALDPIIGREEEIRRALQILSRRTKNNPVLIGEPGVGKTAIAEGLAQRIVQEQVPDSVKEKRVIALDLASMVSGAMYRGQLEERLKGVLKEVQEANDGVILFIDELHTMVNVGKGEGGMDMSNMLKPALAKGELQLMGATTLNEYKLIEKDAALARRFQSVYISEPTVEDTVSILRGLKSSYEAHHGIRIQDEALVAAASLSHRYITDRFQPDKSIDQIDEACAALKLEQESKPESIWKLERDLLTKQIELGALENEHDDTKKKSQSRKEHVQTEVTQLTAQLEELNTAWQAEKDELSVSKRLADDLEQARADLEQARRRGDYNLAGELQYSKIPQLEQGLSEQQEHDDVKSTKLLQESVTADAIAAIVARHTGIPVSRLTGSESQKLLHMEDKLRERVVGQERALEVVSDILRLSRTGLQAKDSTLGNLLFLGPTGVGKTELCKALAEFMFDSPDAMTRIDMSEFGEKHTVSRLIGAPPGYVGYDDDAGLLTESVRRRPYQVILLDEFEKAHPGVWTLLLQLFDDGILTDSHGRTVDFRNTIIVMTSNMGAHVIADLPPHLTGTEPQVQESIMEVVRETLPPELLNRIDEIVPFSRLQRENMQDIAQIGLRGIADRLEEGQNMTLDVSQLALECISEKGYDVRYGARPLQRVLARDVLNPLSRMVLEGGVVDGDTVNVKTRGEAEKLEKKEGTSFGWIGSAKDSSDKNDIVVMRNRLVESESEQHPSVPTGDSLLESG